jgi:hypothetical protein
VGVGIGLWGRVSEACGAHLRSAPSKRMLKTLGLVEVVVGEGLRLGGIELWGLIEAVGEELRGGLFCNPCSGGTGAHHEFGLGRSPGRMEEGRRAGFADVGEDLADGLGVSQKRDEREGCLAGGASRGGTIPGGATLPSATCPRQSSRRSTGPDPSMPPVCLNSRP